jgi:hypothetical protein
MEMMNNSLSRKLNRKIYLAVNGQTTLVSKVDSKINDELPYWMYREPGSVALYMSDKKFMTFADLHMGDSFDMNMTVWDERMTGSHPGVMLEYWELGKTAIEGYGTVFDGNTSGLEYIVINSPYWPTVKSLYF